MTRTFSSCDEAAVDHLVKAGENFFDALSGLDDFEDDGQILREAEKLVSVIDAGAAIAADAASTVAPRSRLCEAFDDGFMERFAVPFVRFPDMDAHQGALALKFLVASLVTPWLSDSS